MNERENEGLGLGDDGLAEENEGLGLEGEGESAEARASALAFPRLVFISPGRREHAHGKTYDHTLVMDREEYDDAIAQGFSATVIEALAKGE